MTIHHHGDARHPPPLGLSLIRLSAMQRLALAGVIVALIWAAALWAAH